MFIIVCFTAQQQHNNIAVLPVYALMARNRWRRCSGGAQDAGENLVFFLIIATLMSACRAHTTVESNSIAAAVLQQFPRHPQQQQPTVNATLKENGQHNSSSDGATAPSSLSSSLFDEKPETTTEGLMFDLSFSHIGPEGRLPDLRNHLVAPNEVASSAEVAAGVVVKSLALSLRECSLGDAGVAEVARSPWVCGAVGATALSLRHNQVKTGAVAIAEVICGLLCRARMI